MLFDLYGAALAVYVVRCFQVGPIELGRGSGLVLVVSLDPGGPLARVFAGPQPGQPGGPDVGVFARDGQCETHGWDVPESKVPPSWTTAFGAVFVPLSGVCGLGSMLPDLAPFRLPALAAYRFQYWLCLNTQSPQRVWPSGLGLPQSRHRPSAARSALSDACFSHCFFLCASVLTFLGVGGVT